MSTDALRQQAKASHDSFVLDEGFEEDDEEVLAFEASRNASKVDIVAAKNDNDGSAPAGEPRRSIDAQTGPMQAASPHLNTLLFDNLPRDSKRSDIETLVGGSIEIVSMKVHRFPNKTMLARIQFCEESDAAEVLKRHSVTAEWGDAGQISVQYAPVDWEAFLKTHPKSSAFLAHSTEGRGEGASSASAPRSAVMIGDLPASIAEALPAAEDVKLTFWDAVKRAQQAAEVLDQRARSAGSKIDVKYRVVAQLGDAGKRSRDLLAETDEKYKLSDAIRSAMEASKARAGDAVSVATTVDTTYGVSKRMNAATSKVGQAGSIAAREIDDSLLLSERARSAANAALENEQIGPVVKRTVSQFETLWQSLSLATGAGIAGSGRKKERPPQGIEQDSMTVTVPERVDMAALLDEEEVTDDKKET